MHAAVAQALTRSLRARVVDDHDRSVADRRFVPPADVCSAIHCWQMSVVSAPSARAGLIAVRRSRGEDKLDSLVTNELIIDALWELLEGDFPHGGDELLDLGAGSAPYAPLYSQFFRQTVTVDVPFSPLDVSTVDVIASADDLPFEDARFDCVLCTEVLEHCARPAVVMDEIARVLKPGGVVLLTTPLMQALHSMPHDYYRYTPSALENLAAGADLEVRSIEPRGDYTAMLLEVLLFPVIKGWSGLSRLVGIDLVRRANPLVLLTMVAPQRAYLWAWRRRRGVLGWALTRFQHWTPGFVTVLQRPREM